MEQRPCPKGHMCQGARGFARCKNPAKYEVPEHTYQGPTGNWIRVCGVHRNNMVRTKGFHDAAVARAKQREERLVRVDHAREVGGQLVTALNKVTDASGIAFIASQDGHALLLSVATAEELIRCLG